MRHAERVKHHALDRCCERFAGEMLDGLLQVDIAEAGIAEARTGLEVNRWCLALVVNPVLQAAAVAEHGSSVDQPQARFIRDVRLRQDI